MVNVKKFILISTGRTGSNQLVDYLNQTASIRCFGEIFKLQFRNEAGWNRIEKIFSSNEIAEDYFLNNLSGYWNHLVDSVSSTAPYSTFREIHVGAKFFYGHRRGNSFWKNLETDNSGIVHLYRDRIFDSYISLRRAQSSDQWTVRRGGPETQVNADVIFDKQSYLVYRERILKDYEDTRRKFSSKHYIEIEYSDISVPDRCSAIISEYFQVESPNLKQTLVKQGTKSAIDYVLNNEDAIDFQYDTIRNNCHNPRMPCG